MAKRKSLEQMSTDELRLTIKRKQAKLKVMETTELKKRHNLITECRKLDAKIHGKKHISKRFHNLMPLPKFIKDKVLRNTRNGMKIRDIVKKVQEAGYKTTSENFYIVVAQALNDKKVFVRKSRGIYANA